MTAPVEPTAEQMAEAKTLDGHAHVLLGSLTFAEFSRIRRIARALASRDTETQRLRDLVRHQRGALHDAELIADEEYAALAGDHGAVARLEGYDALRAALVAAGEREAALVRDLEKERKNWADCATAIERYRQAFGSRGFLEEDINKAHAEIDKAGVARTFAGSDSHIKRSLTNRIGLVMAEYDAGLRRSQALARLRDEMTEERDTARHLLGQCLSTSGADISGYDDPAQGWARAPEAVGELRRDYEEAGVECARLRAALDPFAIAARVIREKGKGGAVSIGEWRKVEWSAVPEFAAFVKFEPEHLAAAEAALTPPTPTVEG